ncbi:MAG TPA: response regulator [Candidatus Dormibacteraeota bacterium]|nr:response regulator [Candidatus Dormibacteraeota bacterium]
MNFLRNSSIQHQLTAVILLTSFLALGMASAGFALYDHSSFRSTMTSEISALADVLGANTIASLTFNDRKAAEEMLNALGAERQVIAACLYDSRGKKFAEYRRADVAATFQMSPRPEDGAQFDETSLTLQRSVSQQGEKIGSIVIVSDLSVLQARFQRYAYIAALVLLVSTLAAFMVSSQLLRLVTEPIMQLVRIARTVSLKEDYSLRAIPRGQDEVGTLIQSFNQMLARIQDRDAALQTARENLEQRVRERTDELEREVVERKLAEAQMRHSKDAAEQASRAKSEFLANMSHEVRTPLNGVMGMTDLVLDTQLTTEQRTYLETVKFSADSLLNVINDILDFSKIEAGKIDLENIDFNLRESLETTLKALAIRADEKGLELLCEVAAEVPEVVRGDSGRLRQVVTNLLSNAIKFTSHGEVALKVTIAAAIGEDRMVHFTVSDTGVGIPADKQKLIFEPFTQADSSTTRKYGGTGLGLSISTRLVAMMGGKIWLVSHVDRGTDFHFTVRLGTSNKTIEVGTIAPPEMLRGVKVLLVDDNRTNLRILEGMLKRWEMKSESVLDGEEAIAQLTAAHKAQQPYALILTDMHMPKMDGFALIERIRQMPELSMATIMMLTSAGHRGDAARCQKLGVSAYLLKPIRQSELREAIARVLGNHEQNGAIPLITRFSLHDARDPTAFLRVLVGEDNPVNQLLALKLLQKRGHLVVVAGNGKEVLAELEKNSYDLVLMDVQMPEMDGFEATAALRKKEITTGAHQSVIAVTAHAMKGDRERCLAAGMDGYLAKPISAQELDELLEYHLRCRREALNTPETVGTP